MDAISCLHTRRTAPKIIGPEPSSEQLQQILTAAVLAPDHKLARPWRFVIIRGEARQRFGAALAQDAAMKSPDLDKATLDKVSAKALRAPLSIAVLSCPNEKAPLWEQQASAAAAAENICLAAHALGLASAWKSVPHTRAPYICELFNMSAEDQLFGWIDLGQADPSIPAKPRVPIHLADFVSELGDTALKQYP